MNFYYEINESVIHELGSRYFASYNVIDGFQYNKYVMRADRVWGEHPDGRAYFVKNRWKDCTQTPVDMKEFFWIKLKCQTI